MLSSLLLPVMFMIDMIDMIDSQLLTINFELTTFNHGIGSVCLNIVNSFGDAGKLLKDLSRGVPSGRGCCKHRQ